MRKRAQKTKAATGNNSDSAGTSASVVTATSHSLEQSSEEIASVCECSEGESIAKRSSRSESTVSQDISTTVQKSISQVSNESTAPMSSFDDNSSTVPKSVSRVDSAADTSFSATELSLLSEAQLEELLSTESCAPSEVLYV